MELSEELRSNLFLVGISLAIVGASAAAHNLSTPDEPLKVGMVEVYPECAGLDVAGLCLGIQKQDHKTFNYDNYTEIERGTDNFYRKVESELMLRAYNTCGKNISGMEWTTEVSYLNKTAEEWRQNGKVSLLSCEKTFHRDLEADR